MNTTTRTKAGLDSNVARGYVYSDKVEAQSKAQLRLAKCQAREQRERKARTLSITRLNPKTIIIHSPQSYFAEALIGGETNTPTVAGIDAIDHAEQVRRAKPQPDYKVESAKARAKRERLKERKRELARAYYHNVVKPRNERKKQLGL